MIIMAIPSFFKQNKPKGFNYKPRYYDPVKEERDARRKAMGLDNDNNTTGDKGNGSEKGTFRSSIRRGSMRDHLQHSRRKAQKSNQIILLITLILLLLVVYMYLRH